MEKWLVVGIIICILSQQFFIVNTISNNISNELIDYKMTNLDFSHNVLGEFGTNTSDICKYLRTTLKAIYYENPFYYISLVCDKNVHAYQRAVGELGLIEYPTLFFDGGYSNVVGCGNYSEYNESVFYCGNRGVADIDISVDVEWLGAVNPVPADGETNVSICGGLGWNNSAMNIDIIVDNNEVSEYDGHLHVYVTEVESSYWIDKFNFPYNFAFLDYACNENIEISGSGTWQDSIEWDGADYNNGYSDENLVIFDDIWQDNTMIIASVFDDNTNYTEETVGKIAGNNTYPKTFNLYFGNYTPPPLVLQNISNLSYDPGMLEFNTTYYWRVDVIDNQGNIINGTIWSFTTRDNQAPYIPFNPNPANGSTNIPINCYLCWMGGDPDFDTVYYDIYFGEDFPLELVEENLINITCWQPILLEFNTKYYWQIVARDEHGKSSEGPIWNFTTQKNLPPYAPYDLKPEDGANNVPLNIHLSWKGGDPNIGELIRYEVYFEEGNPNPNSIDIIGPYNATQLEIIYELPYDLELFKTYYWKIVAIDSQDLTNESAVHSFKTGVNYPPDKPSITGAYNAKVGVPYECTVTAEDPDGDNVSYEIDWGDGDISNWTTWYLSGEEVTMNHSYSEKAYCEIKARAKDIYGAIGEWGEWRLIISKDKIIINSLFLKFITRICQFPLLQKLLNFFFV